MIVEEYKLVLVEVAKRLVRESDPFLADDTAADGKAHLAAASHSNWTFDANSSIALISSFPNYSSFAPLECYSSADAELADLGSSWWSCLVAVDSSFPSISFDQVDDRYIEDSYLETLSAPGLKSAADASDVDADY